MASNVLRNIPSVTELLETAPLQPLVDRLSHNVVVNRVRGFLDDLRTDLKDSTGEGTLPDVGDLADKIFLSSGPSKQKQKGGVIPPGGSHGYS